MEEKRGRERRRGREHGNGVQNHFVEVKSFVTGDFKELSVLNRGFKGFI